MSTDCEADAVERTVMVGMGAVTVCRVGASLLWVVVNAPMMFEMPTLLSGEVAEVEVVLLLIGVEVVLSEAERAEDGGVEEDAVTVIVTA